MNSTVDTLKDAWEWTSNDKMLHVLPLNHVHGLSYGLLTSFNAGAECDMLHGKFQADQVWFKLKGFFIFYTRFFTLKLKYTHN